MPKTVYTNERATTERARRKELSTLMEDLRGVLRGRFRSRAQRKVLRTKGGTLRLASQYIRELKSSEKKKIISVPPTNKLPRELKAVEIPYDLGIEDAMMAAVNRLENMMAKVEPTLLKAEAIKPCDLGGSSPIHQISNSSDSLWMCDLGVEDLAAVQPLDDLMAESPLKSDAINLCDLSMEDQAVNPFDDLIAQQELQLALGPFQNVIVDKDNLEIDKLLEILMQ